MSLVNQETGEVFDEEAFAVSLEHWIELRVDEGITLSESGEPSEVLKKSADYMKELFVTVALRNTQKVKRDKSTGMEYLGWNQQGAALALGLTHAQLRTVINKADHLEEPQPDNGQADLFQEKP
ncbi:hypothetical protein [Thiothrix sp.]|jgi:hypothetical protein|uniref:hypothetical protein n=1 Tax=Thiothrix sp. TaxID=1032 RepID=UPI00257DE3E4|nr:hypothetical protein [Thiothrix sp.]